MTMHFSELFKIRMGEIVPRFQLCFEGVKLNPEQNTKAFCFKRDLDLTEFTDAYFEVAVKKGVHEITKVHLN